jgi:uncharacterized protein YcgL (UPF0745 family)
MQKLYVYRCNKQPNTYLFLNKKGNFNNVPSELLALLGELSFSFEFILDHNKKLMYATATEVLKAIKTHGFYLQLGSKTKVLKEDMLAKFYRR